MVYIQERFGGKQTKNHGNRTVVLYMSFERFLLAVESRDLSQADKILIRVSSFPQLRDQ